MTDELLPPQFIDEDDHPVFPVRGKSPPPDAVAAPLRPIGERKLTFWRTLDKSLLIITGMLLTLGTMMVFSATFNWSLAEFGDETTVLMSHVRNVVIGLAAMMVFARIEPRLIRRFSVVIFLMAVSFLIAVLLFGDETFGARRALRNGRFQPGEFSELATIIYMAAWLGAKKTRVRSIPYGLIPFVALVSLIAGLVVIQPDLSTAAVIVLTSGMMFFLAGADRRQVLISAAAILVLGVAADSMQLLPSYAIERVESYIAGISDLTQTSYHTQQAIISIRYGGWAGLGLGESEGKFVGLPAPHTDSIFAVIGEEMGVVGAGLVVLLYLVFVVRGFQIARKANDAFGALLAAGITIWITMKAMLNIAVTTALLPPSGLPLPFISFGGSSLVVLLTGVGMLLSVRRQTTLQANKPIRRKTGANYDRGWRDRRTRVPRPRHRRGDSETTA